MPAPERVGQRLVEQALMSAQPEPLLVPSPSKPFGHVHVCLGLPTLLVESWLQDALVLPYRLPMQSSSPACEQQKLEC